MGNKHKCVKRAKKTGFHFYRLKQKHMMEVINDKNKNTKDIIQFEDFDPAGPSSASTIQELKPFIQKKKSSCSDITPRPSEKRPQKVTIDISMESSKPLKGKRTSTSDITPILAPKRPKNVTTDVFVERLEESDVSDLEIVASHFQEQNINIGRRIINVSHFYKKIQDISDHGPLGCSMRCIDLIGEKQFGLSSKFTFQCKMCNLKFIIDSDPNDEHYLPVNHCAVAGIISIGGGHSHLEELSAALNLPLISNTKYQNIHEILSKNWEEVAQETMDEAAKKERDLAIAEGRISKDGIPIIDVCVDGCYSKRSYKTKYSALSGAGAIIGMKTGEILYVGVRNKYCYTCDRAAKRKTSVKEHKCFKNYTGPSTGMESDIIVEGFKTSVETHNLIYGRLISDGDSSTYNKILRSQPYKGITVEKIECRNHLLRNFCNKLQALRTDTRYPIKQRKFLTTITILSMRSVIIKAISKNKKDECPEVQKLFDDILISHYHAFGCHSRCKSYFCEKQNQKGSTPDDFFLGSLWQRICLIIQNIAGHARSLIHDVDSNIVKRYHSIVAKYIGGKRINFSLKQSYATRCKAAAVSFNNNKSLSHLYKHIIKQSPQGKLKMLEQRRAQKKELNHRYLKKRSRLTFQKPDENYGENCKKPDMPEEVLEEMKKNFVKTLKKTDEERDLIQKKTILQKDSSEWMELRRSLLTASNFGRVIKRKSGTRCANLVKDILYKSNLDHISSIKHGQQNEKRAIMQLELQEGVKINSCGLFIDRDLPFLGATPDGVYGTDTIIEIKCPITAYKLGLDKAIEQKKVNFWIKNKKNGYLEVNKNHNWYYQIQGQLHVTEREKCLFAVWVGENERLKTEIIKKDDPFWQNVMKSKLESFYMNCLLPEIVDPRFTRNLPIREPDDTTKKNILKQQNKNIDTLSVIRQHDSQNKQDNIPQDEQENIPQDKDKENLPLKPRTRSHPSCSRFLSFDEF